MKVPNPIKILIGHVLGVDPVEISFEEMISQIRDLRTENERLRAAAVHFEQKAAASQGIIDRIKSNFKAALELKP